MQWIHLLDHKLQPRRWRQDSLRNVGFQPPNYTAQQPRNHELLIQILIDVNGIDSIQNVAACRQNSTLHDYQLC
jgi:hypothetical protein